MLSDQQINGLLFVVILHVLFIEPGEGFESVVHDSFEISSAGSGDVGVGRSRSRVVFAHHIAVVGPCIF